VPTVLETSLQNIKTEISQCSHFCEANRKKYEHYNDYKQLVSESDSEEVLVTYIKVQFQVTCGSTGNTRGRKMGGLTNVFFKHKC
jgi:hypothetical protein